MSWKIPTDGNGSVWYGPTTFASAMCAVKRFMRGGFIDWNDAIERVAERMEEHGYGAIALKLRAEKL